MLPLRIGLQVTLKLFLNLFRGLITIHFHNQESIAPELCRANRHLRILTRDLLIKRRVESRDPGRLDWRSGVKCSGQ